MYPKPIQRRRAPPMQQYCATRLSSRNVSTSRPAAVRGGGDRSAARLLAAKPSGAAVAVRPITTICRLGRNRLKLETNTPGIIAPPRYPRIACNTIRELMFHAKASATDMRVKQSDDLNIEDRHEHAADHHKEPKRPAFDGKVAVLLCALG